MPDEKLMRNQSDHLVEVTTENGWVNVYIRGDLRLGMIHVSKYWADEIWTARCTAYPVQGIGSTLVGSLIALNEMVKGFDMATRHLREKEVYE